MRYVCGGPREPSRRANPPAGGARRLRLADWRTTRRRDVPALARFAAHRLPYSGGESKCEISVDRPYRAGASAGNRIRLRLERPAQCVCAYGIRVLAGDLERLLVELQPRGLAGLEPALGARLTGDVLVAGVPA